MPELDKALEDKINDTVDEYGAATDAALAALEQRDRLARMLAPSFALYLELRGHEHPAMDRFQGYVGSLRRQGGQPLKLVDAWMELSGTPAVSGSEREDDTELRPKPGRQQQVYEVLAQAGRPMSIPEVAEALIEEGRLAGVESPEHAVAAFLSRGVKDGLFERPRRGYYRLRSSS